MTSPVRSGRRPGNTAWLFSAARDCHYFNHPPRPVCNACHSAALVFEPVSGRGTIYSFSVMYQPNVAGFGDELPYLNILVELEEQPQLFLVSNLPETQREQVRIGGRVEVYFEDIDAELTLPKFRPRCLTKGRTHDLERKMQNR